MSSVVSVDSVDSSTIVVPLLLHSDDRSECVFTLQPVNTSYGSATRAIACSLLYRFLRVNTGYGCWQTDFHPPTGSHSLVSTSVTALKAHYTPSHCIQVLTAEWLLVWAALKTRFPDEVCNFRTVSVSGEDMDGVECINSPQDFLQRLGALKTAFQQGETLVSPAALLTFCANWFGRMHVYKNVEKEEIEATNAHALLLAMLPSNCRSESTLGALYEWGSANVANNNTALLGALQSVFTHSIALQVVQVHDSSGHVESLAQISLRAPSVALNRDGGLFNSSANVKTYSKFSATVSQYETMLTLNAITVAATISTGIVVGSVLPWESEDSPLQPFMLQCAATAALKQLGSKKRSRTDADIITRHLWRLFPGVDKRNIVAAVYFAVTQEFGGPVDSDASIVSAQTETSIVRDASSTLSSAVRTVEGRPVHIGRLFTKGAPTITLMLTKDQMYSTLCTNSLKCLTDLLKSRIVMRDEEYGRTFVVSEKGDVLNEFGRKNAANPQVFALSPQPGVAGLKLKPNGKPPLWGIVFPFCHLLWLAMDPNPRIHQLLRDLHENCAVWENLDESAEVSDVQKHKIMYDVLNRDLSTCSTWFPATSSNTLTLWFPFDNDSVNHIHHKVLSLEALSAPKVVAKLIDASVLGEETEYIIGELDATTGNIVVLNLLKPRRKTPGLVKKSAFSIVVEKQSVADSSSRSLPRRIAFTVTHLMLMQLFSGRSEVQALQTFLDFCHNENKTEDFLYFDAENNKQELVQRLAHFRTLMSTNTEDNSVLSMYSTASPSTLP